MQTRGVKLKIMHKTKWLQPGTLQCKLTIKNDQYIYRPRKYFTLSTINAQLIKSQEIMIHEMLVGDRIDVCLITETWLRPDIDDDTWVQASSLNTNQFRMSTVNRQKGRGGGLA